MYSVEGRENTKAEKNEKQRSEDFSFHNFSFLKIKTFQVKGKDVQCRR